MRTPQGNTSPARLFVKRSVAACASHLQSFPPPRNNLCIHIMFPVFIWVLIFKTWCKGVDRPYSIPQ